MRSTRQVALALLLLFGPLVLQGQQATLDRLRLGDTSIVHILRLTDGTQLVGRITRLTADSVTMALRAGSVTVQRTMVVEVRELPGTAVRNGDFWFPNPHSTRLLFSPTAFPLEKGTGYFSDIYLFFVAVQHGITDRFSLGAGISVFPGINFGDNLVYLTPKLAVVDAPRLKFSLGAFLGAAGLVTGELDRDMNSLGILYGVASTGTRESNVSLGLGWGYLGGEMADQPVVMLGAQGRIAKQIALLTENWVLVEGGKTEGILSYGVRFLGERIAVDLAFLNSMEGEKFFPGIPFVGFAFRY
ncbi:MAG: hypothetical protein MNPFHGCM_00726 [Gemmatimonadaceae bacterium]|nr:hypothetical protein [Gemmatimonadaceae bacterium]